MKKNLIGPLFILIGIAIGVILSLQIRAAPVRIGSFPLDEISLQKSLLMTFSSEQNELRDKLDEAEAKLQETENIIAIRSSAKTAQKITHLKNLTGFDTVTGKGVRITINDNPTVARIDFSSADENFVQASDLRDLVNALFLKDADAVSINGKRIVPMTSIQPVFDSILIGNFQMSPPFVVEAIGSAEELQSALQYISHRKILKYVDRISSLSINPLDTTRSIKFLSASNP